MVGVLLLALQAAGKYFGGQTVLRQVTLELRTASRTALVGRNGAGKTTLLRLLMGLEEPDEGSIYRREGITVGLLAQGTAMPDGSTVASTAEAAFRELELLEEKMGVLEKRGLDDPGRYQEWEVLHQVFQRRGGYERRARRDAVLEVLDFRGREDSPLERLSGGERTRLGLAGLLMQQPDVLLLDEPTNHLDIDMRQWLGAYLARYPGAVLLVSHDRVFLDEACLHTAALVHGRLQLFPGPPTDYYQARQRQQAIEAATRANERKEYDRLEASAERMKRWAGQNEKLHRRAKAMQRRLERFATDMLAPEEIELRTAHFAFHCEESGELVLQGEHLTKRYQHRLFQDVAVTLRRGDRVALVGPNGAGKTSFLRLLLGEEASDDPRGRVRFGARVRLGYYDQRLRGVDPNSTLIEEMIRLVGDGEAHNLLGNFVFPYDAQYKLIRDLSGGERARLALLKLTLGRYNLLVLDEPTNHLDVEMIAALEAALQAFSGTLLLVSHDRRFIKNAVDLIWELRDGRFLPYEGDWEFYLRKRAERRLVPPLHKEPASPKPSIRARGRREEAGLSRWQLRQRMALLEAEIAELEEKLMRTTSELAAPAHLSPPEIAALGNEHHRLEQELLVAMADWDETATALEEQD